VSPDPKLIRAREKRGRVPIPSHDVVKSEPYVTALLARQGPKMHASPITHLRMGHIRNLPLGKKTFIRDALVNGTDEAKAAFASTRSHYFVNQTYGVRQ
jgi:hypothetical protein